MLSNKNIIVNSTSWSCLHLIVAALAVMLSACAGAPPKFTVSAHDPILDQNGGVVLITDVCIQYDPVGDDYVVLKETQVNAAALMNTIKKYLADNGVKVRATMVPFVCGAIQDPDNQLKSVASEIDGDVTESSQPFGVEEGIRRDSIYLDALVKLSTLAYQHPWVKNSEADTAPAENAATTDDTSADFGDPDEADDSIEKVREIFSSQEYKDALDIVAKRTNSSSVLYVGASAISVSSGKRASSVLGNILVAVASAVAIGPVGVGGGQYAFAVAPTPTSDSRIMSASLINMDSKEIIWSNSLTVGGDILDDAKITNIGSIDLLLTSMVRSEASVYSPPGAPPLK